MMTATRMTDTDWTLRLEDDRGLMAEVGHAIMRPLRLVALHLLDLRTEFDVLAPGEVFDERPKSPMDNLGLAIAKRVRRLATRILDPWTEFAALD